MFRLLLPLAALACEPAPLPDVDASGIVLTDSAGDDVYLSDFAGDVVGIELAWLH
jgi:hypothetical protein